MMNTGTRPLRTLLALAVVLVTPHASGEVAVVVEFDNTRVFGPYSIIDDADPIGGMVWTRQSVVSNSRILLNEDGAANGDGRPATTLNPVNRMPIATWGKKNGAAFDVVVSRFEAGAWTSPEIIAAGVTATLDPEPQMAIDQLSGDVHLVYFVNETIPSVFYTQAPPDLSSWTAPVQVSQFGEKALRPSAMVHQGVVWVAYESHGFAVGNTPRQIVVATSDGAGGFFYDVVSETHHADPNWPLIHRGKGGSPWLDWVDGATDMAWSTWQSSSGWGAIQIEPFAGVADREFHVRGRIRGLANP